MIAIDRESVSRRLASANEEYRLTQLEIERLIQHRERTQQLIDILKEAVSMGDRWRDYVMLPLVQDLPDPGDSE